MGKRGPAKTPTKILKLRGSGLAAGREKAPAAPPGVPDCPEWLNDSARAEWKKQVELLSMRGLLSKSFANALAMYCVAWTDYVAACMEVEKCGAVTEGANGNLIVHPMARIKNGCFDRALRLGQQFGFSPATQSEVSSTESNIKDGKRRFFAS